MIANLVSRQGTHFTAEPQALWSHQEAAHALKFGSHSSCACAPGHEQQGNRSCFLLAFIKQGNGGSLPEPRDGARTKDNLPQGLKGNPPFWWAFAKELSRPRGLGPEKALNLSEGHSRTKSSGASLLRSTS